MQCGLYGKLPTKRDFIAIKAPREFLEVWEPWMQGGLSASRHALGDNWQQTFLTAPIWRFWLGSELCGRTVLGAFHVLELPWEKYLSEMHEYSAPSDDEICVGRNVSDLTNAWSTLVSLDAYNAPKFYNNSNAPRSSRLSSSTQYSRRCVMSHMAKHSPFYQKTRSVQLNRCLCYPTLAGLLYIISDSTTQPITRARRVR